MSEEISSFSRIAPHTTSNRGPSEQERLARWEARGGSSTCFEPGGARDGPSADRSTEPSLTAISPTYLNVMGL